jgi:hypothetical protein
MPEWFDELRDHTRKGLADVERRAAVNASTQERFESGHNATQRDLDRLDIPTRRQGKELARRSA